VVEVPLARRAIFWGALVGGLPGCLMVLGLIVGVDAGGGLMVGLVTSIAAGVLGLAFVAPFVPLASAQLSGLPRLNG
jgi:hypothetical protein